MSLLTLQDVPPFRGFLHLPDGWEWGRSGTFTCGENGCGKRKKTEHGQEGRKVCSDTEKWSVQREGFRSKADLLS